MKYCIAILTLLFSFLSHAQDFPRHMVVLSTTGAGASGSYEKFDPGSSSLFSDYDIWKGDIALNYTYRLDPRWQLGTFLVNRTEDREFTSREGHKGEVEFKNLHWGVNLIYNFSDDLRNAWYISPTFSWVNQEEEFDKTVFDFIEDDRNIEIYEFVVGKRFSLEPNGLPKISYSPSVSVFFARSSKDYRDNGTEDSWGVTLQVLKFDVLF